MAIMTIMAIMALLYPNKVTCFLKHFHSCRSGPERSCFHVEEGVLRPTQVPWSIELWLHPIRPIGFGILPHRRSSCLRLVIHLWLPAGRGLSGTDGTHVTTTGSRNMQKHPGTEIHVHTWQHDSGDLCSIFLFPDVVSHSRSNCRHLPKPSKTDEVLLPLCGSPVDWVVSSGPSCCALRLFAHVVAPRTYRVNGTTKCRDGTSMGHRWP